MGIGLLKLKRLHQLTPRVFYNGGNTLLRTRSSFSSLYKKIITFFYFLGDFNDGRDFCNMRMRLRHFDTKPNKFNHMKPSGKYAYHLLLHYRTLHFAHTTYRAILTTNSEYFPTQLWSVRLYPADCATLASGVT